MIKLNRVLLLLNLFLFLGTPLLAMDQKEDYKSILKKLDIERIGHKAYKVIQETYEKGLTELNFSYDCGKIGAQEVEVLASIPNLKILCIAYNQDKINAEGAKFFLDHPTITELDLRNQNLGDEGAKYIASIPNLETVNVSYNNINEDGGKAFLSHKTLTSINLYSNNISEKTLYLIEEMIENNKNRKEQERLLKQEEEYEVLDSSSNQTDPLQEEQVIEQRILPFREEEFSVKQRVLVLENENIELKQIVFSLQKEIQELTQKVNELIKNNENK
jgi:hypothetical protein